MDFQLTEEQRMIQDALRKFSQKEIAPRAAELDRTAEFPMDLFKKCADSGYIAGAFPEKYGGADTDLIARALGNEEISKACAGFSLSMGASSLLFGNNILHQGSEEQKQKYLPPLLAGEKVGCWGLTEPGAGSDALGIRTTAAKDGDHYVLNGQKTFITNAPIADWFIIIARTSGEKGAIQGGTAFILERGVEGLSTGAPFDKMGLRCSPTGEIFLDDCRVHKSQRLGPEDMAFFGMMQSLDIERAMICFLSIGIAQGAFEAALQYAKERKQFGRPIAKFQLIQSKLAWMYREIELSRTYSLNVLKMAQNGKRITRESAVAKWHASEMATKVALEAVQILGGYGYMKEYPVERYVRDAKLMEIGAGTNEIMQLIIGRELIS